MEYLVAVLVLLISFLQRVSTAFFVKTDFDTFGHLHVAQCVKQQRALPWGSVRLQCWDPEDYYHPYMWHKIVSYFSIDKTLNYQRFINSGLDAVLSTIIFLLVKFIDGSYGAAFTAVGLYIFTPAWFSYFSMGPRIQSFTPRLSSEILMNLIIVLHFLYLNFSNNYYLFFIIFALNIVLFLISKFGLQAQIFITLVYTVISAEYTLSIAFIMSLTCAYVISKGEIQKTFTRQIIHLKEYFVKNNRGTNPIAQRNSLSELMNILRSATSAKAKIWHIIAVNSYTSTLLKMPLVIVFVIQVWTNHGNSHTAPLQLIAIASLIIFFIVSSRYLLFLGEAERYLNHTAVAFVLSLSYDVSNNPLNYVIFGVVIYGLTFWLLEFFYLRERKASDLRNAADNCVEEFLKKLDKPRVTLSFPYHNFCSYRVMCKTQHRSIIPIHAKKESRDNFIKNYEYKNPFVDLTKLQSLINHTNVSVIIIDIDALNNEGIDISLLEKKWAEHYLDQNVYRIFTTSV